MGVLGNAIAMSFIASTALAQDLSLNDAQRRQAHLPSVRAATTCISNVVLGHPNATDMLIPGKESGILIEAINRCLTAVERMVNEHDRLYGPGTGILFYRGPYLNDLPRGVLARIQPRLETLRASRLAEQASQESERKANAETAEKARDMLRNRMYACTDGELSGLVRSGETAEVLASASMTICRKEIDEAINTQIQASALKGIKVDYNGLRQIVKESVVAAAVRIRSNLADEANTSGPTKLAEKQPTTSPVSECLKLTSSVQKGQFVEVNKLVQVMMELCRPEIEAEARRSFIASEVKTLDESREIVMGNALSEAKKIAGP